MKEELKRIREYLMTGVSYMIPIVVIGGVLIAFSIALSGVQAGKGAVVTNPVLKSMMDIGTASFSMMVPVLAGFIAFGIADRPGLAPGLVGGVLANQLKAGFLGGIIAGFIAGYVARWIKSWRVPKNLRPIMPIFVIPLLSALIVGFLMIYILGNPISSAMTAMTNWLKSMSTGNAVILAMIMGAMIAFDMGGPVNKVAFLFAAAMIGEGVYTIMGPVAVAICIPPLGMGVATLLAPNKYTKAEKEAGYGALAMGMIGITEGAIPFAAADPLRVIPSIMVGSSIGAAIAAIGKVGDHAPHGGPIVLPVVDNKIMFIVAVLIGIAVTALMVNALKKPVIEEVEDESEVAE
ncbi:PTS system IIC component, Fru family [Thermoanaerobacter thermohydrosulfuricus]|jgi:fructose-specific PTS system IIC-like component|uniref:PTS system, fructose subfamily, IIC subunit n=2 Tax=Thermoanaerobacter TaxID=1754 RepID=B0KCF9_THEP3|nr:MULTISPECIES: PTS fructose transporter subunit IIC [Thermoanaerobacter]ABY92128.1 PTS system, fructose subfamily, IIC subunit [Thermoanaerobacter sp. X514]ABY94002.1 PTS system, fructose subfamily, IIC subunit [Thermoanaerobacter pseudethanolicus ATCC 33223]SDF34470.1 PTS system IIC component, Fru family [Thermoanaerobacter thermohydrosulfuricus]SFE09622.1 PTS system IIC component, Fru family [Thermoanaerobacter thermohydrosulfuricus]HBW60189.1 PTS fructose-like transporter subunit EIIC [Th